MLSQGVNHNFSTSDPIFAGQSAQIPGQIVPKWANFLPFENKNQIIFLPECPIEKKIGFWPKEFLPCLTFPLAYTFPPKGCLGKKPLS